MLDVCIRRIFRTPSNCSLPCSVQLHHFVDVTSKHYQNAFTLPLTDRQDSDLSNPVVLNLLTYLTLLSNKITRFTPNIVNGAHILKM